jgi:hypothetical protein
MFVVSWYRPAWISPDFPVARRSILPTTPPHRMTPRSASSAMTSLPDRPAGTVNETGRLGPSDPLQ